MNYEYLHHNMPSNIQIDEQRIAQQQFRETFSINKNPRLCRTRPEDQDVFEFLGIDYV